MDAGRSCMRRAGKKRQWYAGDIRNVRLGKIVAQDTAGKRSIEMLCSWPLFKHVQTLNCTDDILPGSWLG